MARLCARSGRVVWFAAGLLLLASCSEAPPQTVVLTIGTGGLGGSYDAIGRSFVRLVRTSGALPGYDPQTDNSAGSVANIEALDRGEVQFGIAQSDHQYRALNGLGEWEAEGSSPELRSVFSIYPEYVTIVAGADTDIASASDLRGKVVDIGTPDSGTQQNAIDVLDAAALDRHRDIETRETDLDGRLSAFVHGDIDAFFFTTGHPSQEIKFATFSVRGARLVPPTDVDGLIRLHPFYSRQTIPVSSYPQLDGTGDVETIGVAATLLTTRAVPADVVYALTKSVLENLPALRESRVDASMLEDGRFFSGLTAPLHPGALRYFDEIGVDVPAPLRSASAAAGD